MSKIEVSTSTNALVDSDTSSIETFSSYLPLCAHYIERPELSRQLPELVLKPVSIPSSIPQPIVVYGPGGAGKTELVRSVINTHSKR